MQDQSARASLLESMRHTEQTAGMTVLEHGEMVADYYEDLIEHLETGTPLRHQWRLPEWAGDTVILDRQMPRAVMREYHVFHDCVINTPSEVSSLGSDDRTRWRIKTAVTITRVDEARKDAAT